MANSRPGRRTICICAICLKWPLAILPHVLLFGSSRLLILDELKRDKLLICVPGGGGGVLRFGSDGGVPLKPPNPYLSLRVMLAEKGTKSGLLCYLKL